MIQRAYKARLRIPSNLSLIYTKLTPMGVANALPDLRDLNFSKNYRLFIFAHLVASFPRASTARPPTSKSCTSSSVRAML